MADFQEDSQCCKGMLAASGGPGGAITLQAGIGDGIPNGTPSRRRSKYSVSGSEQAKQRRCHNSRRKG